jgi:hypothetical protein
MPKPCSSWVKNSALQGRRIHRIVEWLFKGKPAERWGRKTTGLRGFCREV